MRDAMVAGGIAGVVTLPLDYLRTRFFVSGKLRVASPFKGEVWLGAGKGAGRFFGEQERAGEVVCCGLYGVRTAMRVVVFTIVQAIMMLSGDASSMFVGAWGDECVLMLLRYLCRY